MKTAFASPERSSYNQLKTEIDVTRNLPLVKELTSIIPDAFAILNLNRQIVFASSTLLNLLNLNSPDSILGLRLGEAINCIHSQETKGGCGTTKYCSHCGAVNAMVKSQKNPGEMKEEECRLTAGERQQSFEYNIRAKTLEISGNFFILVIAQDKSHEKRRELLERTFFHDILNTAGGLQGLIELMGNATEEEMGEYLPLAQSSSEILVEEILAHREILAAENNKLEIEFSQLDSMDIIQSVIAVYKKHPAAEGKFIRISEDSAAIRFTSDPSLLIRVLGNMMKNGLEAESYGQTLTIGAKLQKDSVEFWVHNPTSMPEEVKLQMFQRSFSTKGYGRGIGTYSIKLLGERYLKGKARFISDSDNGTIFSILLPLNL